MAKARKWVLIVVLIVLATALVIVRQRDKAYLPQLGEVHGMVTLDGKPLPDVYVLIEPVAGGRIAVGNVDKEGKYEAQYRYGIKGANLGPSKVRVTWPDGFPATAAIPAKYGRESELTLTVVPEGTTFDIRMKSE